MMYQEMIRQILIQFGIETIDPRHIEAYMRLEHHVLDGLGYTQFKDEVLVGFACIKADGTEAAERLATSYGL